MRHALRLAFVLIATLAGTLAGAAPIPKDAGRPGNEYYPLTVGTTWVYKVAGNETTVRVAGVERLGKEDCLRMETAVAGGKVSELLAVRADGVYRVKVKDDALKNPVKVLAFPVKLGAAWDIDSGFGGVDIKGKMTVKGLREKVKTPAGEFEAVLVESSDVEVGGAKVQMRFWYAKGVGLVRQEFTLTEGNVTTLELSKFTPGEPAPAPRPQP